METAPSKNLADKSPPKLFIWFWPWLIGFLVGDIWSKWAIFQPALTGENPATDTRSMVIFLHHYWSDHFWIEPSFNTGVAWSMFDQFPSAVAWMTVVLIPVLCFFFWKWFRHETKVEVLAFGSVLGGALGNGWDRLWALGDGTGINGVRDFIHVDLDFAPFDPWPTFNIADIGITVGFIVLLACSFFKKDPQGSAKTGKMSTNVDTSADKEP